MTDASAFDRDLDSTIDVTRLPKITDLVVGVVRFERPRVEYVGTERVEYDGAVAFEVTTSEPFVQRALGPAVFVGDVALHIFDQISPTRYRFYAFEPTELSEGADITVGWPDQEAHQRAVTRRRFKQPGEPIAD